MSFKKTACLAALLASFPLAAPSVSVAADDRDKHYNDTQTTEAGKKVIKSSGFTEEYSSAFTDYIYIGHVNNSSSNTVLYASNNTGNLNEGFQLTGTGNIYLAGGYIEGSQCPTAVTSGNTLNLEDGSKIGNASGSSSIYIFGGRINERDEYSSSTVAETSGNLVEIKKGSSLIGDTVVFEILGGDCVVRSTVTASSLALSNTVNIEEGVNLPTAKVKLFGGRAQITRATGAATTDKKDEDGNLRSAVEASENKLSVTAKPETETTWKISSGYFGRSSAGLSAGLALSHTLAAAAANRNTTTLVFNSNVTIDTSDGNLPSGGYAMSFIGNAEARLNTYDMTGGTVKGNTITAGYAMSGDTYSTTATATGTAKACKNTLNLTEVSHVQGETDILLVAAGYAYGAKNTGKAEANENTAVIKDSILNDVYGGYAETTAYTNVVSGAVEAKNNTVSLYAGEYSGSVYGGYASTESASSTAESGSNTVNLYALNDDSPSFATTTVIWGGYASAGGIEVASTGNTLTFNNVNGMEAANIKNFQNLTFSYTDTTLATNDVVLNLTGGDGNEKTTIANGGKVSVSVTSLKGEGNEAVFKKDDKVYLLKNAYGLTVSDASLSLETVTAKTGNGALECTLELKNDGKGLYLTRTDSDSEPDDDPVTPDDDGKKDNAIHAAPETKAIAEGALAGLALASESAEAVFDVMDNMSDQDVFTFGTVHASNKTYESGSSITVSSVSLIAGLGKGFDTAAGFLSVGAFFEYGKGSYTTHNSFDDRAGIDGDGNSWYMGGGILGKMNFKDTGPGHFYLEGSAHMGTVHNEFDSNGFTDGNGNVAKFDMDSPYYSLHGGLGYVWNMAEGHELNVYGKYMWTMVQGTDDTLTTNAKFDYDDMHSNRIRAGVRYSYTGSERFKPYVGVSYEHEFAGSCDSRAYGYDVNSPSYEGGTGIGELGIAMKPTEALPLSFNLGVQGAVGKKRGVSGNCNIMYEF